MNELNPYDNLKENALDNFVKTNTFRKNSINEIDEDLEKLDNITAKTANTTMNKIKDTSEIIIKNEIRRQSMNSSKPK